MAEIDYPYKLTYYWKDESFTLSKKVYNGKMEYEGRMIDSYKYNMIFDGRSRGMKDRIERARERGGPVIPTWRKKDIEFAADSDKDAIRGVVQLLFEYPDELLGDRK